MLLAPHATTAALVTPAAALITPTWRPPSLQMCATPSSVQPEAAEATLGPLIEPEAPPEHLRLVDEFLEPSFAGELRGCFDENFAEPRQAHPMRFV